MLVWLSFRVICAYLGVLDHAHWKCLDIFVASMHVRPHEQNLLHTSTNSGGIVDSSHLKLWVYPKPLTMSELTCDIYLNLPTYDNSTLHLHSFLTQCPAALTVQKMKFSIKDFFSKDFFTFTEETLNENFIYYAVPFIPPSQPFPFYFAKLFAEIRAKTTKQIKSTAKQINGKFWKVFRYLES